MKGYMAKLQCSHVKGYMAKLQCSPVADLFVADLKSMALETFLGAP